MKVKLGTTPLRVEYTDDELKDRVLSYIDSNTDGVGFRDICDHLLMIANDEGKIIKDSDTDYEWMELDRADTLRVSRALWQQIWSYRLFIDFDTTHYKATDTYFMRYSPES